MDLFQYLQVTLSALGLFGGIFAYVLNLRIQHDISENNEQIQKDIVSAKNKVKDELVKEFGSIIAAHTDSLAKLNKDIYELGSNLSEKILAVVNGKYVRTDLHQQTISGINDKLNSIKELIASNLDRLEEGLDRQISDLKERINGNNNHN